MIQAREILDIIEIAFFGPALPVTIYVCIKHGFQREAGWLLLTILSLIRIVGASCGIAAESTQDTGLIATSMIMSSIGSATLVAAFTGITNRVAQSSRGSPLTPQQRKMIQLIGIASIILGIVGGTKVADSDPDTRQTGQDCIKAAIILVLVQFLISLVILGYSAMHLRHIMDCDRKLFYCVASAVPFLFVRLVYSILASFDSKSSTFSMFSNTVVAVIIRAILGIAMEIITVSLFILAGILAPKMAKGQESVEAQSSLEETGRPKNTIGETAVKYVA